MYYQEGDECTESRTQKSVFQAPKEGFLKIMPTCWGGQSEKIAEKQNQTLKIVCISRLTYFESQIYLSILLLQEPINSLCFKSHLDLNFLLLAMESTLYTTHRIGLPWQLRWWRICLQCRRPGFNPWVGKVPWRREWPPTQIFLPGEFHGQRSLVGYRACIANRHDWATITFTFIHSAKFIFFKKPDILYPTWLFHFYLSFPQLLSSRVLG